MSIEVPQTEIVRLIPIYSCDNSDYSIDMEEIATCYEYFPRPFFLLRGPLQKNTVIDDPVKHIAYRLKGFNNEDEYEDVITVIDENTKKVRKKVIYRFLIEEVKYHPTTGEALEQYPPVTKHSHMEIFEHIVTRPVSTDTDVEIPPFAPGQDTSSSSSSSEPEEGHPNGTPFPIEEDTEMPLTNLEITEVDTTEMPSQTDIGTEPEIDPNLQPELWTTHMFFDHNGGTKTIPFNGFHKGVTWRAVLDKPDWLTIDQNGGSDKITAKPNYDGARTVNCDIYATVKGYESFLGTLKIDQESGKTELDTDIETEPQEPDTNIETEPDTEIETEPALDPYRLPYLSSSSLSFGCNGGTKDIPIADLREGVTWRAALSKPNWLTVDETGANEAITAQPNNGGLRIINYDIYATVNGIESFIGTLKIDQEPGMGA